MTPTPYLHPSVCAKPALAPGEFLFHLAYQVEIDYFRRGSLLVEFTAGACKLHAEHHASLTNFTVGAKGLSRQIVSRGRDIPFDAIPVGNHIYRSSSILLNIANAAQSSAQDSFDLLRIFFELGQGCRHPGERQTVDDVGCRDNHLEPALFPFNHPLRA